MKDVCIEVLTPHSLADRESGVAFLDTVARTCPKLTPQRFGGHEPLRDRFDARCPGPFLDLVSATWGVMWSGSRPPSSGRWQRASAEAAHHGSISLCTSESAACVARIPELFLLVSEALGPDFALLHIVNSLDEEAAPHPDWARALTNVRLGLGVNSSQLRRSIPNLYWATVFGPPYVELFGRELLLSAPAPVVKELDYGGIYIQLSDNILDFRDRFEEVDAVRRRVKEHLNHNAFYDRSLGPDHVYNVPVFHLEREPAAVSREAVWEEIAPKIIKSVSLGRDLAAQCLAMRRMGGRLNLAVAPGAQVSRALWLMLRQGGGLLMEGDTQDPTLRARK